MLKKFLAAAVVLPAAMLMTGCNEPITADQDTIAQMPQVHLATYTLRQEVKIEAIQTPRVGAGQLKVMMPVRNLTDHDLSIDYVYYFYNHGVMAEGPSAHMHLTIPRKGSDQIEFTSLSAVDDFRVEIMDAR